MLTEEDKSDLIRELVACLQQAPEIRKIVVFGSFFSRETPEDLDVAVFLDTDAAYLPLAQKYRRMTRAVAHRIPLDIVPVKPDAHGVFLKEINAGIVIYER